MAHTRLISIDGNGGTWTPVYATQVTRRVEIIEDFSGNTGVGQGLEYQFDDGSETPFSTIFQIAPQTEPLVLGAQIPQHSGYGLVVGRGADASGGHQLPATLLINLRSAGTASTEVRVTEFD